MMSRIPRWAAQHLVAFRVVLTLTVVVGLAYPLAMTAVAQLPGPHGRAQGSLVENAEGQTVGSALIGQSFTDADGNPLKQYFQTRPSAAGDGYDPTSTGASNLGPESMVDTLPDPAIIAAGKEDENARQSLLTQVCERSKSVGELEGVDGSRPYCTSDGVGAVLGVFHDGGPAGRVTRVVSLNQACPAKPFLSSYRGVAVECAKYGADYSMGFVVPIRGNVPDRPAVPADAVTASGSGLDPHISPSYARIQSVRVARARHVPVDDVARLVREYTTGRALGFLGQPGVNVLKLNLALDRIHPVREG
jgi:K+-transporting ATPase ATPase C chain